jgi:hypothetical protein
MGASFAPCLIHLFGPQEFLFATLPGTAKTSRFCSSAHRARDVRSVILGRFHPPLQARYHGAEMLGRFLAFVDPGPGVSEFASHSRI